jgi:hypothetical protein
MTERQQVRIVCRSSETGRFVSKDYAKANPATTQCSEWRRIEDRGGD